MPKRTANVITKKPPHAGELLLAEPFLADPNFARSVIFLSEYTEEGAVGFVLNRPLDLTLQRVVPDDLGGFDSPLFFGGPVEPDTLHYLHVFGDRLEGAMEVVPGVYWGGSFETLKIMVLQGNIRPDELRFYIGYSGWGAGQLESEMEDNSWIKTTLGQNQVFSERPDELWKEIMVSLGGRYRVMSAFPISPGLN
jgi:putative transcriptional regulator